MSNEIYDIKQIIHKMKGAVGDTVTSNVALYVTVYRNVMYITLNTSPGVGPAIELYKGGDVDELIAVMMSLKQRNDILYRKFKL